MQQVIKLSERYYAALPMLEQDPDKRSAKRKGVIEIALELNQITLRLSACNPPSQAS